MLTHVRGIYLMRTLMDEVRFGGDAAVSKKNNAVKIGLSAYPAIA